MTGTSPPSSHDTFPTLARIAIENNILTKEQVKIALHQLALENEKGNPISFEDYLQQNQLVSDEVLKRLLAATVRFLDKQFGELAVQKSFVDRENVNRALAAQKQAFARGVLMPISDILMKWNHLTIRQRDTLLDALASKGLPSTSDSQAPERTGTAQEETGSIHFRQQASSTSGEKSHGESIPEIAGDKTVAPKINDAVHDKASDSLERESVEDRVKAISDEYSEEDTHDLTIEITDQGLKALLHIPGDLADKPSLESVKDILAQYEITYGIMEDSLIEMGLKKTGDEPVFFVVAQGLAPVPGKPATVTLHFNNTYLAPGMVTEDGTIDFRERGSIPFVNEGDLIAEKTPPIQGKPGMDVFGQTIETEEAEDQVLKGGTGTNITNTSDGGIQLTAAFEGQPFMTVHGEVCVFKDLHVKGDVDYSTGNISFDGNIFVKGSIKEGFIVKGGSLTARDVQGATLDIKGNIDVSGGIIDSMITLGGNLQAMYITSTKVDAYGDVLIKKEIIDSKIRTSGAVESDKVHIISSFISAKKGIEVKRVGTDVSRNCTLRVGISDHTNKIIKNIKTTLEEIKKLLEEKQKEVEKIKDIQQKSQEDIMGKALKQDRLNRQKNDIENDIQEMGNDPEKRNERQQLTELLGQINSEIQDLDLVVANLFNQQDQHTDEILSLQDQCHALVTKIEDLNRSIKEAKTWDKKSGARAQVRVIKEIQAQTSLSGPNTSLVLKQTQRNVTIRETKRSNQSGTPWEMVVESN